MRLAAVLLCALPAAVFAQRPLPGTPVVTQESVDTTNTDPTSTWKAAVDPLFKDLTIDQAKAMFRTQLPTEAERRAFAIENPNPFEDQYMKELMQNPLGSDIPSSFDARSQWPGTVFYYNQEKCGSCWAVSATSVLSTRFAIATSNATSVKLSPQDPVSCDHTNNGCYGGQLPAVWEYLKGTGEVSLACLPYTAGNGTVAQCPSSCAVAGETWKKYHASKYYSVSGIFPFGRVERIQKEIMKNGPVQAAFKVYANFMKYSSGVYDKNEGELLGGHAVEIIGWGEENGTPYWLVNNSWGKGWPVGAPENLQSLFKIIRGKDLDGFESMVYAGLADTSSL